MSFTRNQKWHGTVLVRDKKSVKLFWHLVPSLIFRKLFSPFTHLSCNNMWDSSRHSGPVAWNAKTKNHFMCETTGVTRHLPYLYLTQPFKPYIRILTGTFLQCTHSCLIDALLNSCLLSSHLWTVVKSFLKTHHSGVHEMHSSISHDKDPECLWSQGPVCPKYLQYK